MAIEVEGSLTMKDYLVVQSFKAMGLSDSTMAMIENDLRNQHVRSIPESQVKEAIASFPVQPPKWNFNNFEINKINKKWALFSEEARNLVNNLNTVF